MEGFRKPTFASLVLKVVHEMNITNNGQRFLYLVSRREIALLSYAKKGQPEGRASQLGFHLSSRVVAPLSRGGARRDRHSQASGQALGRWRRLQRSRCGNALPAAPSCADLRRPRRGSF